jgi:hypothetical protein
MMEQVGRTVAGCGAVWDTLALQLMEQRAASNSGCVFPDGSTASLCLDDDCRR